MSPAGTPGEPLAPQTPAPTRAGSPPVQLPVVTGYRGFAALMVVIVHVTALSNHAWFGLHTFGPISLFVLSGFLLFRPWSRWAMGRGPQPSLSQFFRRRLMRIYPAYWFMIIIVTFVIYPPSRPFGLPAWAQLFTLTHIYSVDWRLPALEHLWSLGTEVTWYLALPLGASVVYALTASRRRTVLRVLVIAFIASVAVAGWWRWYAAEGSEDWYARFTWPLWLPAFAPCFIGGAIVGHLLLRAQLGGPATVLTALRRHRHLVVVLLVVAVVVANSTLGGPWTFAPATVGQLLTRAALTTVVATGLLALLVSVPPDTLIAKAFSAPWILTLGRWSYGIFLWHMPILHVVTERKLVPAQGVSATVAYFALVLALTIPVAAFSYRFIEEPCLRLAKGQAAFGRKPARKPVA